MHKHFVTLGNKQKWIFNKNLIFVTEAIFTNQSILMTKINAWICIAYSLHTADKVQNTIADEWVCFVGAMCATTCGISEIYIGNASFITRCWLRLKIPASRRNEMNERQKIELQRKRIELN